MGKAWSGVSGNLAWNCMVRRCIWVLTGRDKENSCILSFNRW